MALSKEARAKPETEALEKRFLKAWQAENGIVGSSAEENARAKRRKLNDLVAQESDDDDESSVEGESEIDEDLEEEGEEEDEEDVVNE